MTVFEHSPSATQVGAENISPHYFSASVAIIFFFFFFPALGPRHYDSITL